MATVDNLEMESRMVRMETQQENIIELLQEIKKELRNQPFVPRDELQAMFSLRDTRITHLEETQHNSKQMLISWWAIGISLITAICAIVKLFG